MSNKKKVSCGGYLIQKKIVAVPGCTEDYAAVAALPDKWVPKHAGTTLQNYLKEREQDHQSVLDNIMREAAVINNNIDMKIRKIAENLLSLIKQSELDMDCVVDNAGVKNEPLPPAARNEAHKHLRNLYTQRGEDIASFKQEALALERERANGIRNLLRAQFQRLVNIGHCTPKDLLHEFDQRAYEINQQLLSNSRAYTELEAELNAQADEFMIRIKSNVNQLCLGVSTNMHRYSHSAYLRRFDEKAQSRRNISASSDKKINVTNSSLGHLIDEVEEFDECVALLVQAYKTALLKVFAGMSGKLSDLHKHLGTQSFIKIDHQSEEIVDLENMIERVLRRLSTSIPKSSPNLPDAPDLSRYGTAKMQKSLWSLGERLRETYSILHDSAHLWDAHMVRSALARKLTLACVEDLLTSHDTIELSNEITFNIALEQLHCSSDTEKLRQQYEAILVMLDKVADMYKHHNESENGKLEEFMNFPEPMSKILMAEYYCFLQKFPRPSNQMAPNTSNEMAINSPRRETSTLKMPLPRVILQTELQEMSLFNWRNGFLEAFEINVSLVPEELRHHARLWVDERARALRMRYSLKQVSHSVRKERVKAASDNRFAQLKHHESRLDSHLDAVRTLVDKLPLDAMAFLSVDAPELYPLCQWIDRIQDTIDTFLAQELIPVETKRLKMLSFPPRLRKHRELFEISLNSSIDISQRQIENRIQEARISNVRFMSQLKLFHEGGLYSAQEALRVCGLLMKGSDTIETCLTKSIEALKQRRVQILAMADQKLAPVHRILDEYVKQAKGGVEKRKPFVGKQTTGKKK